MMAKKIPSEMSNLKSEISKPQSLRVLIVEDSESDALLEIHELKKGGYDPVYERVETAAAMKKSLKEKQWDIILCDYKMPEFNAPSAIAALKETNIDIPLIIVSGAIGEETAVECMRLGAHDYIMKGNLSRLCPAIARELEEAESRSKRKQAEEEIKISENKFRAIFEGAGDGILAIHEKTKKIEFANLKFCKIIGYSENELLKLGMEDIHLKKDLSYVIDQMEKQLQGKISVAQDLPVLKKDGTIVYCDISGRPVKIQDQELLVGFFRDITERRAAAQALRASETSFRELANSITDVFFAFDNDLRYTYWNKASEQLTGVKAEDAIGKHIYDIFPDTEETREAEKQYLRVMKTKQSQTFINEYLFNDKRYCFEISAYPTITGVSVFTKDITERKQADAALRESEEKYRTLFKASADGILIADLETRQFQYANPAICRMLGYTEEELRTMDVAAIHPKDDLPRVVAEFEAQARGDKTLAPELPCLRKDGTIIYADVNAVSITVDGRRCNAGFFRDTTERKQVEEAIKESEERFRLVINATKDGIWEWDMQTNQEFFSPRWCEIIGYTFDDPELSHTYNSWASRIHPDDLDSVSRALKNHLEKGMEYNINYRHRHKSGEYRWQNSRGQAVFDESGKPVKMVGCISDITERKEAEEELQRSYHKLRETLIATVNTLASTVEMRDPYTAGHQRRVTILACAIAEEMGLTEEQFDGLRLAGLVHDIGKITVPAEILSKPGRISDAEFNIIKTHPQAGYNVLKDIEFTWPVAQIVQQHHERLDGSGYPQGLKDGEIMLEAQILAVADVVEAMASHRPYRPALGIEAALEEITKNRGVLYDPEVADVCARLFIDKGFALGQEI